jgi:hypothetical protein
LSLKIIVMFSWFVPQNQASDGLSVAPQNRREKDNAGHASRSSGLLRLEASWPRVFQFATKLMEAQRRMVHVASSWILCRVEAEDERVDAMDRIGLFYPKITVLAVLGPRGISIFLVF